MESKRGKNYQDPKSWGLPESRTPQKGKLNETSTQSKIDLVLDGIKFCEQGVDRRNRPISEELRAISLRKRVEELRNLDTYAHGKEFILPNDPFIHQVLDQYQSILA